MNRMQAYINVDWGILGEKKGGQIFHSFIHNNII